MALPRRRLREGLEGLLEEMIISGDLQPGQVLPTEAELGAQYGVSRTVVRETVRSLAARGLVTVRPGVGAQVTSNGGPGFTRAMVLRLRRGGCTLRQVLDFRILVEPSIAAAAAVRALPVDLAKMEAALGAYVYAVEARQGPTALRAHADFHRAVHLAAHNQVVEALLEPLYDLILAATFTREHRKEGLVSEPKDIRAHREIFECIRDRDSAGAQRAMLVDLENVPEIIPEPNWDAVIGPWVG